MRDEIVLRPIGIVHTEASEEQIKNRAAGVESVVEVYPEFEQALDGVEGFSHIFVLVYLHRLRPEQLGALKVRPKHMVRHGFKLEELPLIGVFALDSPTRPNPIGLCLVHLKRREGRNLVVAGLDCFDQTPVLDIKPYQDSYRAEDYTLPEWHIKLIQKAGQI